MNLQIYEKSLQPIALLYLQFILYKLASIVLLFYFIHIIASPFLLHSHNSLSLFVYLS